MRSPKRVLITGITGFIGSHLAKQLLKNADVYGLVREPIQKRYIRDIETQLHLLHYDGSYESVENAIQVSQPDVVYHLATYYTGKHGRLETQGLLQSNIIFGTYLLEAMVTCCCPNLVYTSSIMEYFGGCGYRPLNLYAASKHAFLNLLYYYTDVGLLRAITLVLTDTYGPGDQRPKILNLIKGAIQSGEAIALSDGSQDYDVVYVDDVIQAFIIATKRLFVDRPASETFQVTSNEIHTLRETVDLFLSLNGLELKACWGQRPPAEREIRKAVQCYPTVPGWTQQIPLCDGLKRFWREEE